MGSAVLKCTKCKHFSIVYYASGHIFLYCDGMRLSEIKKDCKLDKAEEAKKMLKRLKQYVHCPEKGKFIPARFCKKCDKWDGYTEPAPGTKIRCRSLKKPFEKESN